MPRRAAVDRAAAAAVRVLRNVRRYLAVAEIAHEPARVVAFVRAHRHAILACDPLRHLQRGVAFGGAAALDQFGVHHQAVAIFDQHIPAIGQLGFVAGTLARQPRFRIAGRLVRVIAARLAVKVTVGLPGSSDGGGAS